PIEVCFFVSSRRRHTRISRDWSSDVCSSDLIQADHNRVESPAAATTPDASDASDADDALPLESESTPWAPVPLQVPGNRTAGGPEWVEPLAADDDAEPAEQPLPPELQQPAPEPTQPEM